MHCICVCIFSRVGYKDIGELLQCVEYECILQGDGGGGDGDGGLKIAGRRCSGCTLGNKSDCFCISTNCQKCKPLCTWKAPGRQRNASCQIKSKSKSNSRFEIWESWFKESASSSNPQFLLKILLGQTSHFSPPWVPETSRTTGE